MKTIKVAVHPNCVNKKCNERLDLNEERENALKYVNRQVLVNRRY